MASRHAFAAAMMILGAVTSAWAQQDFAWVTRQSMPVAMTSEGHVVAGGYLYVFRGPSVGSLRFDPVANQWSEVIPVPYGVAEGTAAELNGTIYFQNGSYGQFFQYSPSSPAVELAPPPNPDRWMALAAANGKLYLIGGDPDGTLVRVYDPGSNTWSMGPPVPTARQLSATAVIGATIYVIGTHVNGSEARSVEAYDAIANTWTTKAFLLKGRSGAVAGVINGRIYVVGGRWMDFDGSPLHDAEEYNPSTNSWQSLNALTSIAHFVGAGGVINGRFYVAGGYDDAFNSSSVTEEGTLGGTPGTTTTTSTTTTNPPQGCRADADCADGNQCTTDSCNLATGACFHSYADGAPCDDGNACTGNGVCQTGICHTGPVTSCGNGTIEPQCYEQCDYNASPTGCGAGQTCALWCRCQAPPSGCTSDSQCFDTNSCTLDACVGGVCQHTCVDQGTQTCGQGICQRTVAKCSAAPNCVSQACMAGPAGVEGPPSSPTCSNSLDDDCNGLADATGPAPDPKCIAQPQQSSCVSALMAMLDPALSSPAVVQLDGRLNSDPATLARVATYRSGSRVLRVSSVATDGLSKLLLKFLAREPGRVRVALGSTGAGTVSTTSGVFTDSGLTVEVPTTFVPGVGYMAFVLYNAPDVMPSGTTREFYLFFDYIFTAAATPTQPDPPCSSAENVITLRPPPVVLVHGIWSCPETWLEFLHWAFPDLSDPRRPPRDTCSGQGRATRTCPVAQPTDAFPYFVCTANYAAQSADAFAMSAPVVALRIAETLSVFRDTYNSAASRASVAAHSMGGLVTRTIPLCRFQAGLFQDCAATLQQLQYSYERPSNYFKGDIFKLITVGSPHLGTQFANRAQAERDRDCCLTSTCYTLISGCWSTVADEFAVRDMPLLRAVDDLAVGSSPMQALSQTASGIPMHTIIGLSGATQRQNTGPYATNFLTLINDRCCDAFGGQTFDQILGDTSNDLIVAQLSQAAGRQGSPAVSMASGVVHSAGLEAQAGTSGEAELDVTSVFDLIKQRLAERPIAPTFVATP